MTRWQMLARVPTGAPSMAVVVSLLGHLLEAVVLQAKLGRSRAQLPERCPQKALVKMQELLLVVDQVFGAKRTGSRHGIP